MIDDVPFHKMSQKISCQIPVQALESIPLTSLIGREQECVSISTLLTRERVRLLTLTGTGGVGKTRLAVAVAHNLRETYANGVRMIPLAMVHNPELVLPTIAQGLEIQSGSRPILEILKTFLCDKQLLLVLDNFEQVVGAAPSLTALLSTCSDLTLLVTSREILRVQGECIFNVSPLAIPDLKQTQDITHLLDNPSVALFAERAHTVHQDFRLTEANAQDVAQICIHLEGLPLSLELAAARIRLLSPDRMLARIAHPLQILTQGRRDAPLRQQSQRNTIQWSYDLLSTEEQTLFRRLCLFIGGSTIDALEGLYQELGDDPGEVLDRLTSLMDKSLIQCDQKEGPRLLVLEVIRAFGLECATALGELEEVQKAQTRYYLRWARAGRTALFGSQRRLWISRFIQEQGNLRAILQYVIEQQEWENALTLGAMLGPFWSALGTSSHHHYLIEGKRFLEQALVGGEHVVSGEHGWSLIIYGELLAMRGENIRGEKACQQGLIMCRQVDDFQGGIGSLWMLEDVYRLRGDFRAARQVVEEAVVLSRQTPERCSVWGGAWTLGFSLHRCGYIALWNGRYQQARELLREGRTLCHQEGDSFVALLSDLFLGEVACFEGNVDEARMVLEQSILHLRDWNMNMLLSEALGFLGLLVVHTGNLDEAHTLLSEGLQLAKAAGDALRHTWVAIWFARVALARHDLDCARHLLNETVPYALSIHPLPTAIGLETLGAVVAEQGEMQWAAQLFAAAEVLREAMSAPMPPLERQAYEKRVIAVRAALGNENFYAIWTQGRAMKVEQVLGTQEAVSGTMFVSQTLEGAASPSPQIRAWGLTRREREVLHLLSEGFSNAQIAERLVLSTVTVNSYLRSIYRKMGVSSRTQAFYLALEQHLL